MSGSSLRAVFGEIRSKYGTGAVAQADRGRTFAGRRFSTGIFSLDLAIGGGVPWGKVVLAYGPESGGKTFIWLKSVANVQRYCRYCREMFMPDEKTGELSCSCAAQCLTCGKDYKKTPYEGPPASEEDPFDWALIHDDWVCECLVAGKTKKKSDRVPKTTRRAGRVRTVWLDAEGDFDAVWARKLGVNLGIVYVIVPEYAEQGIDIATTLLRTHEADVMVVDSIADLVPSGEIEASTEEWQRGLQARLINKACRKWRAALNSMGADNPMRPVILLINQLRAGMGKHGSFEVIPGGKQQVYTSSIIIRLNKASYSENDTTGEAVWHDMCGYTKKNKTFNPRAEFSFRAYTRPYKGTPIGCTQETKTVFDAALDWGVVGRPTKTQYTYLDKKWSSQKAAAAEMDRDWHLFRQIREETLKTALAEALGDDG